MFLVTLMDRSSPSEKLSAGNSGPTDQLAVTIARISASLMFFCNGCAFATWASRIPFVQQNLSLTPSILGASLLMMGLGAIAAMQVVAKLIAKFGSNRVTSAACVLMAGALVGVACARNVLELGATLFIFGVVSGGMDVAMNANAVAVERRAGKSVMASFHALWSFGSMAGALVGGAFAVAAYSLVVHFTVVGLVIGLFGLISSRCLITDQVLEEAADKRVSQTKETVSGQHIPIPLLSVICLLAFVTEGAIADWSALYLARSLEASAGMAAMALTAFSITMAIGRLFGDKVIDALSDVQVLFFGAIITVIGIFLATAFQHPLVAIGGFMLCGVGLSVQVPITFRLAGQSAAHDAGDAIARVAGAGYVGLLLGPPLLGVIAQGWGLRTTIVALSLSAITTAVLARRLRSRKALAG